MLFWAFFTTKYPEAVPVSSYKCGKDHVFSPNLTGPSVLFVDETLPMHHRFVSPNGSFVAEADYSGHLRVFNTVPSPSSIL